MKQGRQVSEMGIWLRVMLSSGDRGVIQMVYEVVLAMIDIGLFGLT